MSKVFINKLNILFLFILFLFVSVKFVLAVEKVLPNTRCSDVVVGDCTKGATDLLCPSCGTTASLCCDTAGVLSKNLVTCEEDIRIEHPCFPGDRDCVEFPVSYAIITITATSEQVCETKDTCNSGETGLRYSDCNCIQGSIYKYCCDANGLAITCNSNGTCGDGLYLWDSTDAYGNYVSSAPCVPKNTCSATCVASGGVSTCSALNDSSFTYTSATGNCTTSGDLCCTKTAIPIRCTTNSDCNDDRDCTTDTCINPGLTTSYCTNVENGFCTTYNLYYCLTDSGCTATSDKYTQNATGIASCQSNLATYYPGETTGVCYIESSDCSAACITGTPSCVPYNCTTINGACGSSDGSTYTSSETPSNLCSSGTATGLSNSYGYWSWTCEGSSK